MIFIKKFLLKNFFTKCLFLVFLLNTHCSHFFKEGQKKLKSPLRIGVIIGPGGALSFSGIGVLKVLQENNIPIHYIVGIGWGAWPAAVFAKNESIDEVRWSLHKLLKKGVFSKVYFSKESAPHLLNSMSILRIKKVSQLENEMKENFGSAVKLKVPFVCPSLTSYGAKIWMTEKSFPLSLKKCLTIPPFFKDKGNYFTGAPFSIRASIDYLQRKDIDIIIWVNPLEKSNIFFKSAYRKDVHLFWLEMAHSFRLIQETDKIMEISPALKKFHLEDFSKIDEIILNGEKEGEILVKRLQNKFKSFDLFSSSFQNSWKRKGGK